MAQELARSDAEVIGIAADTTCAGTIVRIDEMKEQPVNTLEPIEQQPELELQGKADSAVEGLKKPLEEVSDTHHVQPPHKLEEKQPEEVSPMSNAAGHDDGGIASDSRQVADDATQHVTTDRRGFEEVYCDCLSSRIRGWISSFFVIYARFVCMRPWLSLLVPLLFLTACTPGLMLMKYDDSFVNSYISGSYSVKAYLRSNEDFPFSPDNAMLLCFTAKGGKNLLSSDALKEIGQATDKVLAMRTPSGKGWEDVCEKSWRGICEFASVFHTMKDQGSLLGVNTTRPYGSSEGATEFLAATVGSYCDRDKSLCQSFLSPQAGFLAAVKNLDGDGPVVVESLSVIFYFNTKLTEGDGSKSFEQFQTRVLHEVHGPTYHMDKDQLQTDNFWTVAFSAQASNHEVLRPALAEWHLMALAFISMVVFLSLATVSPDAPRSRILISMSCMLIVGLSLVCAIALCTYVGVPITALTSLLAFTVFGVAVDDIVVMVHSYDRTNPHKPVEERIKQSLQESGTAVTLTSATSFVAFMCAAICPVKSVQFFCINAAFAILSVFVLQISLFLPLFVNQERRRSAKQREGCLSLCFGLVPEPAAEGPEAKPVTGYDRMLRCMTSPSIGGGCGLVKTYAKFVSGHRFVQVVIFISFVMVTGLSFVGSSNADTDADLTDYYIDTSFLKRWYRMRRDLWGSNTVLALNIEHQEEGMFSDSRRAEIDGLWSDIGSLEWVFEPQTNWLRDFDTWLNVTSTSAADMMATKLQLQGNAFAFGAKVATFLDVIRFAVPGRQIPLEPWRHKKDVVLEDGKVKHSRLHIMYAGDYAVQATYIKNWKNTYDLVFPEGHSDDDISEGGRVKNVWVWVFQACTAERDARMKEVIFSSLGIACAGVAAVVMLMLNPLVGLFVGVLVVALDSIILAMLQAYGNKLDMIAWLCLSLSIGLVVDYATHTSHAYLHHRGTPDEKLYHSISKMGTSVLSGGGSTFLGVSVLGFASSNGFRLFFATLGTAIFMGTAVGMVVSPVLLRCLHGAGLYLAKFAPSRRKK